MKIVPIKMNDLEQQAFKEARARAVIEGKRVGTWLAEAIKEKLEKQPQK